ncbi:MAG: amidophosphoribosyltransferase, partial [Armatimonadota bacterium]
MAALYCHSEEAARIEGSAAAYIQKMLLRLQHRGQQSAGMTTYRRGRGDQLLDTHRDVGLVSEVFRLSSPAKHQSLMNWYAGPAAIGQVRYATSGDVTRASAQPFETHGMRTWDWFSFAFNGNLANFAALKRRLEAEGHRNLDVDTEVLRHLLWSEFGAPQRPDLVAAFRRVAAQTDGGYALVFLNADGDLVALRDALGLRPLCYGHAHGLFAVASESVALSILGIDECQSLPPGHLLHVTADGHKVHQIAAANRRAFCYFEWVYFADASSTLEGRSVYDVRYRLGEELARIEPLRGRLDDTFVVVPVPETSKAAADGLAHALGVRMMEGIHSNRYIGRTFIRSADRETSAREKYVLIPQILRG